MKPNCSEIRARRASCRKRILDVGCGDTKFKGKAGDSVIGLDFIKYKGVDVVQDLEVSQRLPFKDNEFDLIICNEILEHLTQSRELESELCRVCKQAGKIVIRVPHYTSRDAFTNPPHKRQFTFWSFNPLFHDFQFELLEARITFSNRFIEKLVNLNPCFYERAFCFLIPAGGLFFALRPTKSRKLGRF